MVPPVSDLLGKVQDWTKTIPWNDSVALAVSICVGMFMFTLKGRKSWWLLDMVLSFAFGVSLVVAPEKVCEHLITKPLDAGHLAILHLIGCWLISRAVNFWLIRKSSDERMFGAYFFANAKFLAILLICFGVAYVQLAPRSMGIKLDEKFLAIVIPALVLALAINFALAIRSPLGGYIHRPTWMQFLLCVDNFMLSIASLSVLAFPNQLLKLSLSTTVKSDSVHLVLFRALGCMMAYFSFTAYAAVGFLWPDDKRRHLLARLCCGILEITVVCRDYQLTHVYALPHLTAMMAVLIGYSLWIAVVLARN